MATAPPASASNAELVRWAFEACLNAHDTTPLRQFWTAETVERFPDRTCRGGDEIAAYFEELFAALPDFHMDVREVVEQGEHVFIQWHLTGTHSGAPFAGIATTHKPIAIDGIDHFVLRDGRVVSNFVVFDQMEVGRQLGLLPPDGSPADRALKGAFNAKNQLLERLRGA